IDILFYFNNC
ncbi:hypothetical protein EC902281_0632, partial [Escherichia coli 90.2281]